MKTISNFLLFFLCFAFKSFTQTKIIDFAPWQHPVIQDLEKKAPYIVQFTHSTDADYYVPLAILNKNNRQIYYVNTFGFIFDSIQLGPKLFKQVLDKTIDAFNIYSRLVSVEELNEITQIRELLRKYGADINNKIPKTTYINYTELKSTTSSLAKMILLDNYEKSIWQQHLLLNLIISEKKDADFLQKKSNYENFKPAKLLIHETKSDNHIEYSNSNRFASLRKAIFYPNSAVIYLYNQQDKVFDSFAVKKEKVADLLTEKQDVFALYRIWLEWQIQNVNQQMVSVIKETTNRPTTNELLNKSGQQLNSLKEYYWQLQQNILYSVIPDKDLILINVLQQTKSTQRKKWINANGWETLNPPPPNQDGIRTITRGNVEYFLTDHRGNIIATVSDKKIQHSSDGVTVDYYTADVITATDYAPFGSFLPGRTYRNNGQQLKYGYNGKENDNEVKGEGNQQDYGMRISDPRLGRFLSVDPMTKNFAELTPYQFASNRPIDGIDMDGLEYTPAGRYGANQIAVDATAVQHYPADPFILQKQVENAPERQRIQTAKAIQQTAIRQTQPAMSRYREPDPIQKAKNENNAAAYKAEHPEPTALEKNKHFQKFAENIAMPMIESAILDGAGRYVFKGLGLLKFGGTASQDASTLARAWQGNGAYTGVDAWRNITLKEGSYVAGGLPGQSNFYTTIKGLNRSNLSASSFSEGLQIQPHPTFGYRGQAGIYQVTGNTPAAFGTTSANPQFGAGGIPQIFVPDFSKLKAITTLPLKKP